MCPKKKVVVVVRKKKGERSVHSTWGVMKSWGVAAAAMLCCNSVPAAIVPRRKLQERVAARCCMHAGKAHC